MKTLLTPILLLFVLTYVSFSQLDYPIMERVKTGSTPTEIFMTNVGPVIYCAGIDANFNGQMDEGDEAPSLWLLNQDFETFSSQVIRSSEKLIDLEFKTPLLPVRNSWDPINNVLFIINSSSIDTVSFEYKSGEITAAKGRIFDNISNISAVFSFDKMIFISVRISLEEGYVYLYNRDESKFTDTITAGIGVQMTEYLPKNDMLIILNEGSFGKDDGSVQMVQFEDGKPGNTVVYPIGGTPNHFYVSFENAQIFVTCNASNDIIMMNFQEERDTIKLDMPPYDGPRETNLCLLDVEGIPDPIFFATTAYDGNVYIFDKNGNMFDTLDAHGKAESLFSIITDIIIATPFQKGTYTPDTMITVYSKILSSVDEVNDNDWFIYPNPVDNFFSVSMPDGVEVEFISLYNNLGEIINSFPGHNMEGIKIDKNLPSGVYFLNIAYKKGVKTLPLIVR